MAVSLQVPEARLMSSPCSSNSAQQHQYGFYDPSNAVDIWEANAQRQAVRDTIYWQSLSKYLNPGSVLELGAACGQVSRILENMGFRTVASDYQPFFVEHMQKRGMRAEVVDATDYSSYPKETFDNVIAQSLTTQMRRHKANIDNTYRAIHSALRPGGCFLSTVALYPSAYDRLMKNNAEKRALYLSFEEHAREIKSNGLFEIVDMFRYQVLPSRWYTKLTKFICHQIDVHLPKVLPSASFRGVIVLARK